MDFHFADIDHSLVSAWKREFSGIENIHVVEEDILSIAEDTIVSPANAYGFMDGSIDRQYLDFFGISVQNRLQDEINRRDFPEGYLPVGKGLLIPTGHDRIPCLIAAPTMITPSVVPAVHSFQAMIAVLDTAYRNRKQIRKIYCPGLATGIGQVPPEEAAREMALAVRKWISRYKPFGEW